MNFWREKSLWLPLALIIFFEYMIQRGFATFAKAPQLASLNITDALSVYFLTMSSVVLIGGILLDNFSSRKLLLGATLMATIGLITIPYTIWGFGLIFGSASALLKLAPFTAPLKLKDGEDAYRIAPQASAKNFGGAFFSIVMGTLLLSSGLALSMTVLGFMFLAVGLWAYYSLPDDKVQGWKWSIFKDLAKDKLFWLFMLYFFFMNAIYYVAVAQLYPSLVKTGWSKQGAIYLIAGSYVLAGILRFQWGKAIDASSQRLKMILMFAGNVCMAAPIFFANTYPMGSLIIFTIFSAMNTPIYWAYAKAQWGSKYISTVIGLGFVSMYLGAGLLYGKWV
jgi:MFS family permease